MPTSVCWICGVTLPMGTVCHACSSYERARKESPRVERVPGGHALKFKVTKTIRLKPEPPVARRSAWERLNGPELFE